MHIQVLLGITSESCCYFVAIEAALTYQQLGMQLIFNAELDKPRCRVISLPDRVRDTESEITMQGRQQHSLASGNWSRIVETHSGVIGDG